MKGKIESYVDYLNGIRKYRITYIKTESYNTKLKIDEEDMDEFMENIHEDWSEILTDKLNKLCKSVMKEESKKGKQDK